MKDIMGAGFLTIRDQKQRIRNSKWEE